MGLGFGGPVGPLVQCRDSTPLMENQMDEKIENEAETGVMCGFPRIDEFSWKHLLGSILGSPILGNYHVCRDTWGHRGFA